MFTVAVFGGVLLFVKAAGIRRIERMIGKADCAFGGGKRKYSKEKEKRHLKHFVPTKHLNSGLMKVFKSIPIYLLF